ncbi:PIN domain-containing protein [Bacillus toyonensis]
MEPIESEHSLLSGHVVLRDKNIYMFLDTCVWINNADKGSFDLFAKLADLNEQKDAILLIPEQLRKEWDKNKREKLIINKRNEFNDMFKKTKKFRDIMITDNEKKMQLDTLITEAESVITEQIEYVNEGTISLIDQILDLGAPINTNDEIKLAATDMALQSMAPFHKNKNSMGMLSYFKA